MSESAALALAIGLVATLFAMLATILGWLGAKVISRLDEVVIKLGQVSEDLHSRINAHETRLTVIERELDK